MRRSRGAAVLAVVVLTSLSLTAPHSGAAQAPDGESAIIDATRYVFRNSPEFCVCGTFRDDVARASLRLSEHPLGPPLTISPGGAALWFTLPPGIRRGRHLVAPMPGAVGLADVTALVHVVEDSSWIEQDRLLAGGAPTTMRVFALGTMDELPVTITNNSTTVVRLVRGDVQTRRTTGGPRNPIEELVQPLEPGVFDVAYEFTTPRCPCATLPQELVRRNDSTLTVPSGPRVGSQGGGRRPPASAPPADDPASTPTCPVFAVEGRFAPSQGVWQDDIYFPDQEGKQLRQVGPALLMAELPMVVNRPTRLFGTVRPVGGAPELRRNEVFIRGQTLGSRSIPVTMRFEVTGAGASGTTTFEVPAGVAPVGGPCTVLRDFEIIGRAHAGLPEEGSFHFGADGDYTITATVWSGGAPVFPELLKVVVTGSATTARGPSLLFRPVHTRAVRGDALHDLREAALQLAQISSVALPDFFPLPRVPLRTAADAPLRIDVTRDAPVLKARVTEQLGGEPAKEIIENHAARESVARMFDARARQSSWDRVLLVLAESDFRELILAVVGTNSANGVAISSKLILLRQRVVANDPPGKTVAHEVAHTAHFGGARFSDYVMRRDCQRESYHNAMHMVAHGPQLMRHLREGATRRWDGVVPIMGPGLGEGNIWITQCTYRHLLGYFSSAAIDPPVLLVSGYIARHEGRHAGVLMSLYQYDSFTDLESDSEGSWAIVLRDAEERELGRYAFEPHWLLDELELDRPLVGFAYRVPAFDGLRSVELVSPTEIVDRRVLSLHAPEVTITAPLRDMDVVLPSADGTVRVEWTAADADGDPLLSTVLYSADGGESWTDVVFEIEERELDLPVRLDAREAEHRVLVRVTDGARSTDASRTFRLPLP